MKHKCGQSTVDINFHTNTMISVVFLGQKRWSMNKASDTVDPPIFFVMYILFAWSFGLEQSPIPCATCLDCLSSSRRSRHTFSFSFPAASSLLWVNQYVSVCNLPTSVTFLSSSSVNGRPLNTIKSRAALSGSSFIRWHALLSQQVLKCVKHTWKTGSKYRPRAQARWRYQCGYHSSLNKELQQNNKC